MKHSEKWDELNLKMNEIQIFSEAIEGGIKETDLLNAIIRIHNRAFVKGKEVVLNCIPEYHKPF